MTDLEYLFDRANKAGFSLSIEEDEEFGFATMTVEKEGKKYKAHFSQYMKMEMRPHAFEFYLEKAIMEFDNFVNKT